MLKIVHQLTAQSTTIISVIHAIQYALLITMLILLPDTALPVQLDVLLALDLHLISVLLAKLLEMELLII